MLHFIRQEHKSARDLFHQSSYLKTLETCLDSESEALKKLNQWPHSNISFNRLIITSNWFPLYAAMRIVLLGAIVKYFLHWKWSDLFHLIIRFIVFVKRFPIFQIIIGSYDYLLVYFLLRTHIYTSEVTDSLWHGAHLTQGT